jgi:hypothetical protein
MCAPSALANDPILRSSGVRIQKSDGTTIEQIAKKVASSLIHRIARSHLSDQRIGRGKGMTATQ